MTDPRVKALCDEFAIRIVGNTVLSRSLKMIATMVLNLRGFPNRSFPFRHGLQAVNVDGESRAF